MSGDKFLLTQDQRSEFTQIPDNISEWEIARYYTLTDADIEITKRHRRDHNRLGFAIQLCLLRYPGWAMTDIELVPTAIVQYIANQLSIDPYTLTEYANRKNTQFEHFHEIRQVFGFDLFLEQQHTEFLSNYLLTYAMENDNTIRLLRIAVRYLRENQIILPGITTLEKIIWDVRNAADDIVIKKLNDSLSEKQKQKLDTLIESSDEKRTLLGWLKEPIGYPSPKMFQQVIEKLNTIRALELNLNIDAIHPNRIRQLARLGSKYSPHALRRFKVNKRYAMLSVYLDQLSHHLVDVAIEIHDKQINILMSKSRKEFEKKQKENGKSLNEQIVHFRDLGSALIEARKMGIDPFEAMESVMSWEEFVESVEESKELARPISYDYLDLLDKRYGQLRKYTPALLKYLKFSANNQSHKGLIEALNLIHQSNVVGKRRLPTDAPVNFISKRWAKYVFDSTGINRHYYEMATLSELKNRIRSGDITVKGSQNYKDFNTYLLNDKEWDGKKEQVSKLAVSFKIDEYLSERFNSLSQRLEWFNENMDSIEGLSIKSGQIHIEKMEKETPEAAKQLSLKLYKMLPRIKLTDLLIEVDNWTGFINYFTHASTKKTARKDEKSVLLAALMAMGMNIGLSKMADSTPAISYMQIANTAQWRMYDEAMQKAQSTLVNYHHKLHFSSYWGDGSTSSSDGMRVQVGVSSLHAEHNPHYGSGRGTTMYRFVSDQYSTFYTRIINTNTRDAVHVIDGLLYHETDLDIKEHYTDTAGYTDQVFGLTHLLGYHFAPRIRDISDLKLYSIEKASEYSKLEEMLTGKINLKVIQDNYDDVLKLAYSILDGKVSGSLIMSKLGSYSRQNALATALREMGRIEKTIFIFDYISNESLRRRIQRGLNKGEAVNSLARAIFFGKRGELRERELQDQLQRASALNIIINAISIWNTVYLQKAVEYIKGYSTIDEGVLKHIAPLGWEHINFLGEYIFDINNLPETDSLRPLNIGDDTL